MVIRCESDSLAYQGMQEMHDLHAEHDEHIMFPLEGRTRTLSQF